MCNNFENLVETLRCQFLCCYPLHCIEWKIPDLSWEQQQQLIEHTVNDALNKKFPIKIGYQLNFLKRLIGQLEKNCSEVHDAAYESYCQLQQQLAPDTTRKYAYKHYLLPRYSVQLTMRESKSFVAEGTTGLCSWQASLAMADFLLHHPEWVHGKNVIELGSGTGLCGFILLQCCKPKEMLLTDGSPECIELMRESVLRNFPKARNSTKDCFMVEESDLRLSQLAWNAVEENMPIKQLKTDILLAADVNYDDTVFGDLMKTINCIFSLNENQPRMLLAATVRNEYTLGKFMDILGENKFEIEEKEVIPLEKSNLYWDRTTPVKIFLITKS